MEYRTDYFSGEIVRQATGGCCHDFAFALSRRTGWKVCGLWRDPVIDRYTLSHRPAFLHAFCLAPDGSAVDVEGVHTIDQLKTLYSEKDARPLRLQIFESESGWTRAMEEAGYEWELALKDYKLAAAEKVIASSPKFLALIEELKHGPRPAAPRPSDLRSRAGITQYIRMQELPS